MSLYVHAHATAGGFDYVIAGRGTACVAFTGERAPAAGFRVLLASTERDQIHLGLPLVQVAWYLPRLTMFDDPLDVGAAIVSYLRRHPQLLASWVVCPQGGLVPMVVELVSKAVPRLRLSLAPSPAEVLTQLRALEPDVPAAWHELSAYPAAGELVPSGVMRATTRLSSPPPPSSRPPPRRD